MGKIGEFLVWGQSNTLENSGEKSPKNLKFWVGDKDRIFGHPTLDVSMADLLTDITM